MVEQDLADRYDLRLLMRKAQSKVTNEFLLQHLVH